MATDTNVEHLVVNKMTQAQYDSAVKHANELYLTPEDNFIQALMDKVYPVGSIFMSATLNTTTKVHNALGGTWVAWGAGRVPVGVNTSDTEFSTVEKTGGEKTHKLIINEMPKHTHTIEHTKIPNGSSSSWGVDSIGSGGSQETTNSTGGDQAHNNLQPYITCYMYKRTA